MYCNNCGSSVNKLHEVYNKKESAISLNVEILNVCEYCKSSVLEEDGMPEYKECCPRCNLWFGVN